VINIRFNNHSFRDIDDSLQGFTVLPMGLADGGDGIQM
jgi:hypothetical protein